MNAAEIDWRRVLCEVRRRHRGCELAVAIRWRASRRIERNGFAPQVRIGLHSAEAPVVADDYVDLGVHEAARLGALAEGAILTSRESVETAALLFAVSNEGAVSFKGLTQPVRVISVEWRA